MTKSLPFYQYIMTQRGRNDEAGQLAEAVFEDLMFPKYAANYHELSDYIENYGTSAMSLAVFDEQFEAYQEWLKF